MRSKVKVRSKRTNDAARTLLPGGDARLTMYGTIAIKSIRGNGEKIQLMRDWTLPSSTQAHRRMRYSAVKIVSEMESNHVSNSTMGGDVSEIDGSLSMTTSVTLATIRSIMKLWKTRGAHPMPFPSTSSHVRRRHVRLGDDARCDSDIRSAPCGVSSTRFSSVVRSIEVRLDTSDLAESMPGVMKVQVQDASENVKDGEHL